MDESAASIIRNARLKAALTQTELARLAGMAQSVISAYESGRREPSLGVLRKVVTASGFDLELSLSAAEPRSPLRIVVDRNRSELRRALMRLGARNVRLFGSVARGDDGPDSDVDILVDLRASVGLIALGQMRSEAERILGTTVDIVLADGLKPDLAKNVLAGARAL